MKLVQCEPPDSPLLGMGDMTWYTLEPGGVSVYGRIGFPHGCELPDGAALEEMLLLAHAAMGEEP